MFISIMHKVKLSARNILATNMRSLRLEKRLSQESLADLAGLHRTFIGAVERCERNISLDNAEKIAVALKVDLGSLLTERRT